MNLYENIKLNLNESERKTKIIEKRKSLKESSKVNESNLNESDNKNEILSKIFAHYPDISEEDEDFLNGLSYEDLITEVKNRGWHDALNESDNADLDKVRDIANEFVEYLRNNQIFAELIDYDTVDYNGPMGKVVYGIEWGDWKHDHLASEELAKQFFGSNINIDDVVTEEDGSDTYSANHEITFDLDNYTNSQDGDKMSETEKLKRDKRKTSLEENAK